jgi:CheY-like chemotaxis protein
MSFSDPGVALPRPEAFPGPGRGDGVTTTDRSPDGTGPRATILIVEDHADSRDAMGLLVSTLGYRAVLAGSGAEALAVLEGSRLDLVLCDVRMPGMDGFAFVRTVRSRPGGATVKLVAVTGLSDPADVARLRSAGFDGHLVKPLDYDALVATLDRILSRSPERSAPPVPTAGARLREVGHPGLLMLPPIAPPAL